MFDEDEPLSGKQLVGTHCPRLLGGWNRLDFLSGMLRVVHETHSSRWPVHTLNLIHSLNYVASQDTASFPAVNGTPAGGRRLTPQKRPEFCIDWPSAPAENFFQISPCENRDCPLPWLLLSMNLNKPAGEPARAFRPSASRAPVGRMHVMLRLPIAAAALASVMDIFATNFD